MLGDVLIYLLNIYQKVLRIVNFFLFSTKGKSYSRVYSTVGHPSIYVERPWRVPNSTIITDHMEHHPRLPPLLTALLALFVMLFLSLITIVVIVQSNLFHFEYISRLLLAKYRCKSISCACYTWIKNRITHLKLRFLNFNLV